MAPLRASFASRSARRSSASMGRLLPVASVSSSLQLGQRLAKPGLPGFSSNSSLHTTHVRIGNAMAVEIGGAGRNRTGDGGFADLGLTTWLPRQNQLQVVRCKLATGRNSSVQPATFNRMKLTLARGEGY